MTTQQYPLVNSDDPKELLPIVREIVRLRDDDIQDFTNLPNVYARGRKVERAVPTSSTNVLDGDRIGDFFYDAVSGYRYDLIDNAGTPAWRRITLGVW